MSAPSTHLSALTLDALALGGLAAEEAARAREHLASCQRCQGELEAGRAARVHFQENVFARSLPRVQERARTPAWRRSWVAGIAIPALATAVALVLIVRARDVPGERASSPDSEGSAPALGIKGAAVLQVFASREARVFPVHDGSRLAPGDRIRFVVSPAGLHYLLIASVDGSGNTTVYHPYGGTRSGAVDDGPRVEIPGSIVLDAAPGPERIYALFSRAPIDADQVTAVLRDVGARGPGAIRQQRTVAIPTAAQDSVVFEKVVR
jgi:hypothetical protein